MTRFLLDTQLAHANIYDRSHGGMTALLSAANSIASPRATHDSARDYVAQGEELVEMLLDRGACARDIVQNQRGDRNNGGNEQPSGTVLSLAISQASPKLIGRLIDEGADVHIKTRLSIPYSPFFKEGTVWDVTHSTLVAFMRIPSNPGLI